MSNLKNMMNELNETRHQDIEFTEKLLKKYIPLYESHKEFYNFYVDSCVNDENDEDLFYNNLKILGEKDRVDFMWSLIKNRNNTIPLFNPGVN